MISTRYYGQPAVLRRALYRDSPRKRRKASEAGVRSIWLNAKFLEYRVEPESDDGSFHEQLVWTVRRLLRAGMTTRLPLFTAFEAQLHRVSLTSREEAVVYPYPIKLSYNTTVRGVAEEIDLPSDRRWEAADWQLHTRFEREGDVVRASSETTLSGTRFEPENFRAPRLWYAALRAAGNTELRFPR